MPPEPVTFEGINNDLKKQKFDNQVDSYIDFIYPKIPFDGMLHLGKNFFFIYNNYKSLYHYIDPNVRAVLGYDPSEVRLGGVDVIRKIVHPDDVLPLLGLVKRAWETLLETEPLRRKDYIVNLGLRARKKDGNQVRLLLQYKVLDLDKKGNIVYTLGVITDITRWQEPDRMGLTMIGPGRDNLRIIEGQHKPSIYEFSKRELEVLKMLADGNSSKDISEKLFISPHTVDKHRKNMLKKVKVNKTAGLIKLALKKGLI